MDNNWNRDDRQWDKWNSSASNSSYYNQPTHRPYGQAFSVASAVCGLLSVTTSCTIILSLPLGALGLLFAALAHRKKQKWNPVCLTGIVCSCMGLVMSLAMIVYSFAMLPSLLQDEAFRNQMNAVTQQMYGMDFADFMEKYYVTPFQK